MEGFTGAAGARNRQAPHRRRRQPRAARKCRPHTGAECTAGAAGISKAGGWGEAGTAVRSRPWGPRSDGGRGAFIRVVFLQPLAQLAGFHADDGVRLRVKIGRAVEHLNAEDQLFDAVGLARQGLLDDVRQESPGACGGDEWTAGQDRLQLLPYHFRRWNGRLCDRLVWQACPSFPADLP